jgi:hypothetical protein
MVDSETDDPPAVEISPRFVFSRSTHYWRFHLRRVIMLPRLTPLRPGRV